MVSELKSTRTPTTSASGAAASAAAAAKAAADEAASAELAGTEDIVSLAGGAESANINSAPRHPAVADNSAEMKGMIVTDGEATDAVAQLSALPAAEAKLALQALAKNGALDALAGEVDDDARGALVDVMVRAGFIGSEAGSVGGGNPKDPLLPRAPVLGAQNDDLSRGVSKLVREENLSRLDDFNSAFKDYRDGYQQQMREVRSFEALRALGPIAEPRLPVWEPGTRHRDDDHEWSKRASMSPDVKTGQVVTDTVFRLNGTSPPGVDFVLEATIKGAPSPSVSGELKMSYSEDRSGSTTVDVNLKTKAKASVVPGVKGVLQSGGGVTVTDGKVTGKSDPVKKIGVDMSTPGGGGVTVLANGDEFDFAAKNGGTEAKFKLNRNSVEGEVSADGNKLGASVKTSTDAWGHERTTVKGTVGVEGVTATAGLDSDGGIIAGVGVDNDALEAQLEMTVQLTSAEDYARAFATIEGTPFTRPPEMERGVKFKSLPESAQAAYAHLGWDEAAWTAAQKSQSALSSARIAGR